MVASLLPRFPPLKFYPEGSQPKVNRGNGGRVHFPKHRRTAASQTCAGQSGTDDTTAP
ncbi:hypothetical protein KGM_200688 [Danaus plexippus plexippus]|uniref:Uncharacterized protein n=1 Tax=Danaus plexippus plexippus TaxID=278856 RepID=A0A212EXE0_DANPL|nr:hypothetical protein KGM_200688 [Danaus plexippus plexippus]